MRPTKLTLCGFCSYAQKEDIAFDQLGSEGVYLICGDTGSGKTTLFDGITYALYGQSSGKARDAAMLRCRSFPEDQTPYVRLEFTHDGQPYAVERSLPYHPPRRKTEIPAEAQAWRDGELIADGLKKVTETMESLLGLTFEQFTQVAMIAQGGFMELLRASSLDRRRIFRQLFSTEMYEQLQDRVRRDSDAALTRLQNAQERIRHCIVQTALMPEDKEAFAPYMTAEAPDVNGFIDLLDKLLDCDETLHADKTLLLRACREQKLAAAFDEQRGKNQLQRRQELERLDASLTDLTKELQQAEILLHQAENRLPEAETIKQKIYALQGQLEKYERRDQHLRQRMELERALQNLKQNSTALEKTLNRAEAQLQHDENALESLSDAPQRAVVAQQETEKAAEQLRLYRELTDVREKTMLQQQHLKQCCLRCDQSARMHDEKCLIWQQLDSAYYANLVGSLAFDLSDGTPCPVCGSTTHPRPAPAPSERSVTRSDVDAAKAAMDQAGSRAESDRLLREKSANALQHLQEDLQKRLTALLGESATADPSETLPALLSELQSAHQSASERLKAAKADVAALETIRQMRLKHQEELVSVRQRLQKAQLQTTDCQASLQAAEASLLSLSEGLQYPTRQAAEDEIHRFKEQCQILEQAVQQAKGHLEALQQRQVHLRGRKDALEEQQAADSPVHLDEIQRLLETLTAQESMLESECEQLAGRCRTNRQVRRELPDLQSAYEEADKCCRWLGRLHSTFNGKLSLEAWVQTAYFDRILYQANLRLRSMTGGQYELLRRQEELNARQSAGLNLDVIDHVSGAIRSVASLSGGESFKAALSLALGLSDEIRASSGGVKLEAMFVDEGFGSLDDYSLRQALSALTGVSNAGCLVGIISHVDELKHRIDRQIIVSKDSDHGSRVRIV